MKQTSSDDIENNLRNEYFSIQPQMEKLKRLLIANIEYHLNPLYLNLKSYQRIEIRARIKEFDSAITTLKKRQEFKSLRPGNKLLSLKDLIGIRILVFPDSLIAEVKKVLMSKLGQWRPNHVFHEKFPGEIIAWKYYGKLNEYNMGLTCELQIVPMLIGLFWDIEHFTYYKPHEEYKFIANNRGMKNAYQEVLDSLKQYEEKFDELRRQSENSN